MERESLRPGVLGQAARECSHPVLLQHPEGVHHQADQRLEWWCEEQHQPREADHDEDRQGVCQKQHTEVALETMKSLSSLGSTSTASIVALSRRLQAFWEKADDNPRKALQDEVGKMTPTKMADLIDTISSKKITNTAHYLEIISPELFGKEGRHVREIKEASSSALEASTACVQYAFSKGNLTMKDFKLLLNFSMNSSSSSSAFRELAIRPSHKTKIQQ